jgi:hypothetical protein
MRLGVGSRRVVILIAAVVIAAVAGFATVRYLQTVQDRANKGAKLDTVFEIKKPVAKGTTGLKALNAHSAQVPAGHRAHRHEGHRAARRSL